MFQWSDENIQSQLPLQPGAQLCIAVCLYAHSDFLLPPVTSPGRLPPPSVGGRGRVGGEKGEGAACVCMYVIICICVCVRVYND